MNSIKAEIYKIIMEDIEPLLIDKPQIALVGRSNVGKSSLINYLCGCNTLARTSKDPGKTKTINYYSCNEGAFFIVDLPGYGYAKVSKETRNTLDEYRGFRHIVRNVYSFNLSAA